MTAVPLGLWKFRSQLCPVHGAYYFYWGCWVAIQPLFKDRSLAAYFDLATKAAADNKFWFPVKPKCHVPWLKTQIAGGSLKLFHLMLLALSEAWQELAYQQELHSALPTIQCFAGARFQCVNFEIKISFFQHVHLRSEHPFLALLPAGRLEPIRQTNCSEIQSTNDGDHNFKKGVSTSPLPG